jgi:transcription initiation factor TFIIIB Brf1 subunit/transcription initiation factor TFIIB
MAIRRVVVKKTTPGAQAFTVGDGAKVNAATQGPAGGLTPSDLASAYGYTATASTTQTIAVVDAFNDPNINADLQTFDSQYALPACSTSNGCLKIVNQTGGTTLPANDTTGWSPEIALDVETAHSVCQHCKVILVEATNDSGPANLAAAANEAAKLGATEISNSYGYPESMFTAAEIADYNHPGVVITASSGDDGWHAFDYLDEFGSTYNAVYGPSSLNTVVSIGGTSLYLGQTATRQSESVWNDDGIKDYDEQLTGDQLGATGGGCSTVTSGRTYQINVPNYSQTLCGTKRSVADVSAVGDYLTGFDILNSYNCGGACSGETGWLTIGGTSLSSPLIAGMWALAGGAGAGVQYPSLNLYGHLGGASLYDVKTDGNGWCDGVGAANCGAPNPNTLGNGMVDCSFPATGSTPSAGNRSCDALSGYDGPTGVGAPTGLTAFQVVHLTVKVGGPATIVHNTTGTWTATVTDPTPGMAVTGYTWNWGDGTTTTTTTASTTHKYTTAATRTLTVTATDTDKQTGTGTLSVKVT